MITPSLCSLQAGAGTPATKTNVVVLLARHMRRYYLSHSIVLGAVRVAVGCGIGSKHAIKDLVDLLDFPTHESDI